MIDSVASHKDLGILFDNQLKFHEHTTKGQQNSWNDKEVFRTFGCTYGVKAIYNFNQTNS